VPGGPCGASKQLSKGESSGVDGIDGPASVDLAIPFCFVAYVHAVCGDFRVFHVDST